MSFSLIVVTEDGATRTVSVPGARQVVGREKSCALRVPEASVSRQHCELAVIGGQLAVRDLGSSNGTFVNGKRIESATLEPGDLVGVGPLVLVVVRDGSPGEVDPADAYARGQPAQDNGVPEQPEDLLADLGPDPDSSSEFDFDFDLSDDDDDQPEL